MLTPHPPLAVTMQAATPPFTEHLLYAKPCAKCSECIIISFHIHSYPKMKIITILILQMRKHLREGEAPTLGHPGSKQ